MKRSKLISTLAIAAMVGVLGVAGAAFAESDNNASGKQRGGFYGMTDEQHAEMKQIHEEHYKKMVPLRQQMMVKQAELDALHYGGSADEGKVQALYREIADLKAKMFSARSALRSQLEAKGLPGQGWGGGMMRGDCSGMMRGDCGGWGGRGGKGWHDDGGRGWHDGDNRGWHDGGRGGHGGRHR
ncbi:MAG: periplasmic heavy metal sensor [Deltaproteobacteria bacterium]|nr:periplasmic heavy metal sensor [Deltaproteobacteria bacterium]